jgi:hypothetical protein
LMEAYRRLPREKSRLRRLARLLLPSGMVLGSGTQAKGKALPQMSGKARAAALVRFLRNVEPDYRREALRFMAAMIRQRPEHFQQAMDYLVTGYHYFKFTRDTIVPECTRVLAEYPDGEPLRPTPSALPHPAPAPPDGMVQIRHQPEQALVAIAGARR